MIEGWLVTGMPGVGKSSMVAELKKANIDAIDLDDFAEWKEASGKNTIRFAGKQFQFVTRDTIITLLSQKVQLICGICANLFQSINYRFPSPGTKKFERAVASPLIDVFGARVVYILKEPALHAELARRDVGHGRPPVEESEISAFNHYVGRLVKSGKVPEAHVIDATQLTPEHLAKEVLYATGIYTREPVQEAESDSSRLETGGSPDGRSRPVAQGDGKEIPDEGDHNPGLIQEG
jgi:hypothetical protein